MDANQTEVVKRVYSKPEVTEVRLVATEAVLGDCKDAIGGQGLCGNFGNLKCINNAGTS